MNILIGNYNNYFNRQVKVPGIGELEDYEDAMEAADTSPLPLTYENINFNENDGVSTELILGKGTNIENSLINGMPDYLVCYGADEAIESRWFILDMNRTRGGQWKFTLRRDVLVDFGDAVDTAPIYVEKGIISDYNNPLICNNEGLVVNQIKTQEELLYDKTQCPWLCMYLKKGVLGSSSIGSSGKVAIDVPETDGEVFETLTTPIGNWSMATYTSTDYKVINYFNFLVFWTKTNTVNDYQYTCNADESSSKYITGAHYTTNLRYNASTGSGFRTLLDGQFKTHYNNMLSALTTDGGFKSYDGIMKYNGKIIKDSTGKYYQINVRQVGYMPIGTGFIDAASFPTLKPLMTGYWNAATTQSASPNDAAFGVSGTYSSYRLTYTEVESIETTVDFSAYTGNGCTDSVLYDVIAMPYGDVLSWGQGGLIDVTSSAERSMRVMNSLARNLGTSYVLDLQLLPYCPMPELINTNYTKRMSVKYLHDQCLTGEYDSNYTDIIYVPNTINFTFDISKTISITDSSNVSAAFKKKYVNDCTMVRLCSPNYNGVFEMNLAKNNMAITSFNVDVTLKPQTPYIHVNPKFEGLYGNDWNDARGLICGGDFSLGLMNEAWIDYEIQNKNYQNIFDRQIQNIDINNAINKQEAMFQMGAGVAQGTVGGATAGGISTGSPYGAIAGAVLGAGGATLGGVYDLQNLERRQRETKEYAIDNFNLQLGNIKALPYGLTRTDAITFNNKKVPFIEVYECTPEEKEAYYLKLKYDGMKVGKIGYYPEYEGDGENYFKGQVIRLPDLRDDSHVANAINEEIMKGVYI